MKTISAIEFKAKCLQILDAIPAEGLAITKNGKVVAEIHPHRRDHPSDFFGSMPDMLVEGADIFSTGISWNAERGILD